MTTLLRVLKWVIWGVVCCLVLCVAFPFVLGLVVVGDAYGRSVLSGSVVDENAVPLSDVRVRGSYSAKTLSVLAMQEKSIWFDKTVDRTFSFECRDAGVVDVSFFKVGYQGENFYYADRR